VKTQADNIRSLAEDIGLDVTRGNDSESLFSTVTDKAEESLRNAVSDIEVELEEELPKLVLEDREQAEDARGDELYEASRW
jgi:hypothetical protein